MHTRTIVLATCVGVLIAAIAIVVVNWPKLPARTLPRSATYIPMGGQAVEVPSTGCLVPMIRELRKLPSWSLRIDDMRWTDYTGPDEDPRHASIFVDASGGTWRDDWLPQQTLPLTGQELADALAAFELGCDVDESIPSDGYEGRYINIAYGPTEKAAAKLAYHSPAAMRMGEVFEALRARYVANRAGASKEFVMKLAGVWRSGEDEWTKKSLVIDARQIDTDDEDRVRFVDWALALPATLPAGRMVATGTFTLAGVTRPIAVDLHETPANTKLRDMRIAGELVFWMSINRE